MVTMMVINVVIISDKGNYVVDGVVMMHRRVMVMMAVTFIYVVW